jgi:hypothetical protein
MRDLYLLRTASRVSSIVFCGTLVAVPIQAPKATVARDIEIQDMTHLHCGDAGISFNGMNQTQGDQNWVNEKKYAKKCDPRYSHGGFHRVRLILGGEF